MKWKSLEEKVRKISEIHFGVDGVSEDINGIKFDCVIKRNPKLWSIIEVTKRKDLEKVRTDINRISLARRYLFEKMNIMTECFFVVEEIKTIHEYL